MQKRILSYGLVFTMIILLAIAYAQTSPKPGETSGGTTSKDLTLTETKPPTDVGGKSKEIDLSKWCKNCKLIQQAEKEQAKLDDKEGIVSYKKDKVKLGEFPEGTKFITTEKGIEVILPKKLDKLPTTGSFTIDAKEETELPDGNKLLGKASVVEGQLKVGKGNTATINNIVIGAEKNDVDIFFGEAKDSKNFVNFGKSLVVHGDGFNVALSPGNKYANVEPNDLLMLSPHNGGTMTLTPRDKTVPSLVVTGPSGVNEWGTVWNGQYKTTFGEKGIVKNSIEEIFAGKKGSVPLEADVVNEKGEHLIKDKNGKPYTLLYDNENRQYILPKDVKINADGSFVCPERKATGDSERLAAVKERLAEAGRRAAASQE